MVTERVSEGNKFLLAGPAAAAHYALEHNRTTQRSTFDFDKLGPLLNEYRAIHGLLSILAGADKLVVVNTSIDWLQRQDTKMLERQLASKVTDIHQQPVPQLHPNCQRWVRDAHSIIDGKFYPYTDSWMRHDGQGKALLSRSDFIPGSGLGVGGAVLTRKQVVLIGVETSWEAEEEMDLLQMDGIRFGIMPIDGVNDTADHIDGYATLVEDKYGDVALVVARSYYESNSDQINAATRQAGTGRIIIDDDRFPPLAFNLVQFDDLSIAMTDGAEPLKKALQDLVGSDAVHTTEIPIELLPERGKGSIRCLTNITPEFLLP